MAKGSNKGTSRSARGTVGKSSGPNPYKRPRTATYRGIESASEYRRAKERERREAEQHFDDSTKRVLEDIRGDQGWMAVDGSVDPAGDGGLGAEVDSEWVDVTDKMTPEALARAVDSAVKDPKWSSRHYRDGRTWKNRRARVDEHWAQHYEAMADAYLRWKYRQPSTEGNAPVSSSNDLDITIAAVDLFTLEKEATIARHDEQVTAVALVEGGYLGNSPVSPSIAISLKTLDLYKILRQRKPSFSFEAFAKVLCDLYQKPYRRQWRIALADAFDVFLIIKKRISDRVAAALGRDSENWRVLNACPPCTYELENEKPLIFRILMALDGNNSAKRVDNGFRQTGDTRDFKSSYWLDPPEVDKFKLEDIRVKGPEVPELSLFEEGEETEKPEADEDGGAGSQEKKADVAECVKNWKAAQVDSKKRVMDMFDETGWFACGCRHGLIFWVADMVRTGEQAKYPLSIINRAMEVLGDRLLIGYDIGCAFEGTIMSTTLGKKFKDGASRCCVNAYHGYAHNYACQCTNHPNNIPGVGIEDLETMERFFSASNATAPVIRHASKYRRRMLLDLFLEQYDKDKYGSLGLMLRNNYVQALTIIRDGVPLLEAVLRDLGASHDDLDKWQVAQATYFSTVGKEPEEDAHKVAYVELLQELQAAEKAAAAKTTGFLNAIPEDWGAVDGAQTYSGELSRTRKLETTRKAAREKVDKLLLEVVEMELKLGIVKRWDSTMPEYIKTNKYIRDRQYHRALDNLQRLVVQRLFELHRLGLSGIGYRARSLLAKALRTRSKAIQNAVSRYNEAAGNSNPPRPTLDWTKIAKYNFVEEFSILRDARSDIRPERWTDGEVREAMKLHQRIKRAREEIDRLHIEMGRLYTAVYDEQALFKKVRQELADSNQHHLMGALNDLAVERKRVNRAIVQHLDFITELPGYEGPKKLLGVRKGCTRKGKEPVSDDVEPSDAQDRVNLDSDNEEEDEEEVAQMGGVMDFLAEVSAS